MAAILADQTLRYAWTCVDWALRLSDCAECGAELATGPRDCVSCAIADERRWALEDAAPDRMTGNERALRQARSVLRAPARHRSTVVSYWRLVLPFLLTGEVVGIERAEWLRACVLAGRYRELATFGSYVELASNSELPWRDAGAVVAVARGT